MSISQYDSGPTSNDLLESLIAENTSATLKDPIVAQGTGAVRDIENASPDGIEGVTIACRSVREKAQCGSS